MLEVAVADYMGRPEPMDVQIIRVVGAAAEELGLQESHRLPIMVPPIVVAAVQV